MIPIYLLYLDGEEAEGERPVAPACHLGLWPALCWVFVALGATPPLGQPDSSTGCSAALGRFGWLS